MNFLGFFEISQAGKAARFDFGLPLHNYYSHLQLRLLASISAEKRFHSTMGGEDEPE
jgi:hypothetical protein